jgi:DNA repair exonuclease SbcCD ATPase subunit
MGEGRVNTLDTRLASPLLYLLLLFLSFRSREQSNFQLIVITHDETFVDEIGRRAHAEHYYRVYKDSAQHSKIRKQVISHEE